MNRLAILLLLLFALSAAEFIQCRTEFNHKKIPWTFSEYSGLVWTNNPQEYFDTQFRAVVDEAYRLCRYGPCRRTVECRTDTGVVYSAQVPADAVKPKTPIDILIDGLLVNVRGHF